MFLKMYEAVAIICIFIIMISFKLMDSEKYEKIGNILAIISTICFIYVAIFYYIF